MRTNFDPPYPPDEPEAPPSNGDWVCPLCKRQKRGHNSEEYKFCLFDGARMNWRSDSKSDKAVYCDICQDWIEPSEFQRWTGDDQLHYLCPGCDSDMVEPKVME